MTINIPPDLEQVIYRQLSSGRFARAEDVLRAALANLDMLTYEEELKSEAILALMEKHTAVGLLDRRDDWASDEVARGGIQPGTATVQRLPEFFTSSDDSFVPADIPMPKGRFIQPVKGGKRLPEFHGIS